MPMISGRGGAVWSPGPRLVTSILASDARQLFDSRFSLIFRPGSTQASSLNSPWVTSPGTPTSTLRVEDFPRFSFGTLREPSSLRSDGSRTLFLERK